MSSSTSNDKRVVSCDVIDGGSIDPDKCDGCGLCISVCERSGLKLKGNVVIVDYDADCDWCTMCEAVCPKDALICAFEIIQPKEKDK